MLVLDNHRSHHNLEVKNEMTRLKFKAVYLPSASSFYSSVENCWSTFKVYLNKILSENRVNNPYLNAEIHLQEMVKQALAITGERTTP